jgi:PPM family protein phosphatase
VVADGLGGHVAGDIASVTVVDALRSHDRRVDSADLTVTLGHAVNEANEALRRKIRAIPELAGMGTTLVAMLCTRENIALANVGDSRAYLLRSRYSDAGVTPQLTQLTEDHTYENLVSDAAEVLHLPERISRYLDGRADGRSPDISIRNINIGDRLLLCSDGLSSIVSFENIHDVLLSYDHPGKAGDRLIELTIERGGPDNITVVVVVNESLPVSAW